MSFTPAELEYLRSQPLGRLATVDPQGRPQNSPVGFAVRDDGTVDIGGWAMGETRKYRNVQAGSAVALVVDDLASRDPWTVRGVEIRGDAEALADTPPPLPGMSPHVIRIHPRRIIAWGVDPAAPAKVSRNVPARGGAPA